jgi:hypothetical protein
VIGVGHAEQVGDRASVTAAGGAEAEGRAGRRAVDVAGRVPEVLARDAVPARHLERDDDEVADGEVADGFADGDHFGGGLVTDGVRAGEQPVGGHRRVEIATGDGERPDDGVRGCRDDGVGGVLPLDTAGFDVSEVAHLRTSAGRSDGRRSWPLRILLVRPSSFPAMTMTVCIVMAARL